MNESGEIQGASSEQFSILEPVGPRIIGQVDPQTLSEEEFEQSSERLYHGAPRDFPFSQEFDYKSPTYALETAGSTTIGLGLYTTDLRSAAESYSSVRGAEEEPIVIKTLLPYEARVLDLRATTDVSKNAPFPKALAEKWNIRYKKYITDRKPREGILGRHVDASEEKYAAYLDRVMNLPSIDLRVMLETAPQPQLKSRRLPSPPWTSTFSQFMREEGFDGLVYVEGGEGQNKQQSASYVFYNLRKIGTYESWKSQTRAVPLKR